ncbi:hypothetical protein [Sinomonas albida]|uniref:hypothetical protein n=1 Tax=Sinomonas albida TaxID=369942 RepID=UPI0010A757E1|nr:hypothetical protein [Sinomonas albida]
MTETSTIVPNAIEILLKSKETPDPAREILEEAKAKTYDDQCRALDFLLPRYPRESIETFSEEDRRVLAAGGAAAKHHLRKA